MTILVVYESMFGNARDIAAAVAEGLASGSGVILAEVSEAPTTIGPEVELVRVGAPTHTASLSRPSTRRTAAERAPSGLVSPGIGVREWLEMVRPDPEGIPAVAFDTALRKPRWIGFLTDRVAGIIEGRLRRRGFRIVAPRTHFWVSGDPQVLIAGELGRARQWGEELATALAHDARRV